VPPPLADNSTYGNTEEIHTEHLALNLTVDFDARTLSGQAYHQMRVVQETSTVQFDIWDLDIAGVFNSTDLNSAPLNFTILQPNPAIGSVLQVALPRQVRVGEYVSIGINYTTSPKGQAFSWLTAAQTAGQKIPYMFTQCEDINCRSVAPLQDTPSNRITYSANITAPKEFVVKMSANETAVWSVSETHNVAYFECNIPIPSYLIAMAIGDLEYRSLGERVGVITEPSQMDKVANELSDMGMLLDSVEEYMGPYIWGNYTVIVLPPSFPMGGMENPLLTFASPTIIVGDKSQVYVATHEMAHSWTGNEITCQNWENFWLNEGFTVFVERHVSGEIHGEDFARVAAQLGNTSMYQDMENFGLNDSYASLHPVLRGRNPDGSFSEVPYEKGFQLLYYLESLIGRPEMKKFLNFYMSQHKLTSITTIQLRETWEFYVENEIGGLSAEEVNQILGAMDWSTWMYKPGLPPVQLDFSTAEGNQAEALALAYIALNGTGSPENFTEYNGYYSNLKVMFHDTLQANYDQVNTAILVRIDADLNVTNDLDPEVRQRWYPTGLGLFYDPVYDPAHTWISSMGRSKYLTPVYTSLQDSGQHDLGVTWFCENIDFYHPVSVTTLEGVLEIDSSACDTGITKLLNDLDGAVHQYFDVLFAQ
jgi:leukotriene-A4 hydrolase